MRGMAQYSSPSSLGGEGVGGWGGGRAGAVFSTAAQSNSTPHPNPSPQGGRAFRLPSNLNSAAFPSWGRRAENTGFML